MNEQEHRRHKRTLEIEMALAEIDRAVSGKRPLRVLEFGSGDGFQIRYLSSLGKFTASDIYTGSEIRSMMNLDFKQCSITETPFPDNEFDLIFSNHVIEHIEDWPSAVDELRRIGKKDCLYAFTVPTNIWLLLSLPAQYWSRGKTILSLAKRQDDGSDGQKSGRGASRRGWLSDVARKLLPRGHGVNEGFVQSYRNFRIAKWRDKLSRDFEVIETKPLLLYGPSELPIIKTRKAASTFCSSVLFTLRKRH